MNVDMSSDAVSARLDEMGQLWELSVALMDAKRTKLNSAKLFTHWACFDCRKSFSKQPSPTLRKCPDCTQPMTDMGPYFEPPRKAAVKRWQVMKMLADNDLRFNSKAAKSFIDRRILVARNPRVVDVLERIEEERQRIEESVWEASASSAS